jgi:TolA-binding protein
MQGRLLVASLIAGIMAVSGTALAQGAAPAPKPDAKAGGKAPAQAAQPDPATLAPKGPLKDPENKKGLSPYMEAIAKGEASFVARDFPGAIAAFQDAAKIDPQHALAFYRLGEAQLASGKPEEAEAVWTTAQGKNGPDELKAKVLFVIADLRERQRKMPEAKAAWDAYAAFVKDHPESKGYAATAAERQKVIDKRLKDEKDYAVVKERIAKRQEEREKEAAENAKKDKLNR